MRIDVLTLFPEMFTGVLDSSILRRAAMDVPDPRSGKDDQQPVVRKAVVSYHLHNIRDHSADDKHAKVDSPPYGGGPGMVMQCQPVWDAVQAATAQSPLRPRRILTTPKGKPLTQGLCEQLAAEPRLMIIAGHYEGLDQRVIEQLREDEAGGGLEEISVGDYVLSGGELPAMVMIDSVVRLLPGALGHADSAHEDSFSQGVERLLDHPHYTRPPQWQDRAVPEVLMGGNHKAIREWRAEQSRALTRARRPDLMGLPPANGSGSAGGAAATGSGGAIVTVRDAGPADQDALCAVHAAAFPTDAEAKLTAELLDGYDVLFSIAAEVAGQVVGHALLTTVTHEDGGSVRGLAGLAPISVHPDYQNRGIGSALVREAIRQCRENRITALFVLGEPEFYGRLGFQTASKQGFTNDFGVDKPFQAITFRPDRPAPPGRVSFTPAFNNLGS